MKREMTVNEVLNKWFDGEVEKINASKKMSRIEFNRMYRQEGDISGIADKYRKNIVVCDNIPFGVLAWLSNKGVLDVQFLDGERHVYGILKGVV